MNLRLPVLAAVVTAAAAVAGFRALHRDASAGPAPDAAGAPFVPVRAGADGPPRVALRRTPAAVERVTVYVAGAVSRAGVYALPAGARAIDALKAAGGAAGPADLVAVNLAEPLTDGEEIVVPVLGADPPSVAGAADASSPASASRSHGKHRKRRGKHRRTGHLRHVASRDAAASDAGADAGPPATLVDLNHADENELETLPGIGASLAERIVAFRETNGPYGSPDDLLDVGGMTQSRLDAIAPYVIVR